MKPYHQKPKKEVFTVAEKEKLYGFAHKIGEKHNCSGMYVRYIINGQRNTNTVLAQKILKDIKVLLELLSPET